MVDIVGTIGICSGVRVQSRVQTIGTSGICSIVRVQSGGPPSFHVLGRRCHAKGAHPSRRCRRLLHCRARPPRRERREYVFTMMIVRERAAKKTTTTISTTVSTTNVTTIATTITILVVVVVVAIANEAVVGGKCFVQRSRIFMP